jgi:hypothetical protein
MNLYISPNLSYKMKSFKKLISKFFPVNSGLHLGNLDKITTYTNT